MAVILYFTIGIIFVITVGFIHNKLWNHIIIATFLVLQTAFTIFGFFNPNRTFLAFVTFDPLAMVFLSILTILSYFTVSYSINYLNHRNDSIKNQSIYLASLMALIISMTGVYLANHVGAMWVMIEATTLSVSPLIYHERNTLSLEATWKYVFICSIGAALAFVGILFLGMAVQHIGSESFTFSEIGKLLANANPLWLKISFIFILVGYSTKMGLFPMQTIAVDAHTVAPPPISAFISTTLMNVGFLAIFRTYLLYSKSPIFEWCSNILLISGLCSIAVSAIYLLSSKHVKRMSAYSSLEHMGLAAMGIAMGPIGYFAVILHLILHSFTKASLFYHLGLIHRLFHSYKVKDITNYFNFSMLGSVVFFCILLVLLGIPPSGMFVTEFLIFKAMFANHHYIFLVITLLLMTLIIYSIIKNGLKICFAESSLARVPTEKVSTWELLPQLALLVFVFWLGYFQPQSIIDFIQQIAPIPSLK